MAEYFPISDRLTKPQIDFFSYLDDILELMDVSTEEFVDHYLEAATDIVCEILKMAAVKAVKNTGKKRISPSLAEISHWDHQDSHYLKHTKVPIIKHSNLSRNSSKEGLYLINAAYKQYEQGIGILKNRPHVSKIYKRLGGKIASVLYGITNLYPIDYALSKYSTGVKPMKDLCDSTFYNLNGLRIDFPENYKVFLAAVQGAALHIASEKNVAGLKDEVSDILGKMNACSPECFWPEELLTQIQTAQIVQTEQKELEIKKARLADLKSKKEAFVSESVASFKKMYAEERTPQSYELTDAHVHAGRIKRTAAKDWETVKDPTGSHSVLLAEQLWHHELEPLRALLNKKTEVHRQLGDALFSDPIMRRAGYAYTPTDVEVGTKDRKKIFSNGQEELSALQSSFVVCTTKGFAEDADDDDREIAHFLCKSPIILALAHGDRESLEMLRGAHHNKFPTRER